MKRFALLISSATCLSMCFSLVQPAVAFNPFGGGYCGANNSQGQKSTVCSADSKDPLSGKDQEGLLLKVTKLVSLLAGVAAVIIIIIGGLEYIMSSGDSSRVNNAKNMILFAVIGLIIVILAQAIINFVVTKIK